jgi:hypothetical protein
MPLPYNPRMHHSPALASDIPGIPRHFGIHQAGARARMAIHNIAP